MAGSKKGGKKAHLTLLAKFDGDEAALKRWRQQIGRKGGENGNTGGFHANPELASRAGRIGGKVSRRSGAR